MLRFHAGFSRGSRCKTHRELLVVLRGSLEARIDDFAGHVLRVETLPAGNIVASAIFFAERNYLPVTVSAMGCVELACFSRSAILGLAREEPVIQTALLRDMGNRAVFLAEKLRMTQFASIEEKLAVYLIEQADRSGCQEFEMPHSKRELAELFGVTRPSLSRVFMQLVDEGYISQTRKELTIREPEELRKIAENVSD
jgi:CRP/FNR family transcriptional regulator, dissimilatory nitrate respiration regulator